MTIIDAGLRSCEKCGKPFTPRSGSGGCVQRFCGTDCRLGFHRERLRSQRIGLYAGQSPQQPATQADHDAGRITPTGSPPTSEQKEAAILETRPLEDRIGELEAQVAKLEEELARERFEHNATRGLYRNLLDEYPGVMSAADFKLLSAAFHPNRNWPEKQCNDAFDRWRKFENLLVARKDRVSGWKPSPVDHNALKRRAQAERAAQRAAAKAAWAKPKQPSKLTAPEPEGAS